MGDNVAAQRFRYPDLDRLCDLWMYSPSADLGLPDHVRETIAWAFDQIVEARDELAHWSKRHRLGLMYYGDMVTEVFLVDDETGERVDLDLDSSMAVEVIELLKADLAEARELLKWVWKDEREWIGGRLCDAIEVAIDAGKVE